MHIYSISKSDIENELSTKKTASAKKAFLTRSKKQATELLNDLTEAYHNGRRYLGDAVSSIDIDNVRYEIALYDEMYTAL